MASRGVLVLTDHALSTLRVVWNATNSFGQELPSRFGTWVRFVPCLTAPFHNFLKFSG